MLSANLAVSFAGDIKFAELAFQSIGEIREVNRLLVILKDFHLKSAKHTEFILTKGHAEDPQLLTLSRADLKPAPLESEKIKKQRSHSQQELFAKGRNFR